MPGVLRDSDGLNRRDVEGDQRAVDGQQHRLGVAIHAQYQVRDARHRHVGDGFVRHEVGGSAPLAAVHGGLLRADKALVRLAVFLVRQRCLLPSARVFVARTAHFGARLGIHHYAALCNGGRLGLFLLALGRLLLLPLLIIVDLIGHVLERLADALGEHFRGGAGAGHRDGVGDEDGPVAALGSFLGGLIHQTGERDLNVVTLPGAHLLRCAARLGPQHQRRLAQLEADGGPNGLPKFRGELLAFAARVCSDENGLGGVEGSGKVGAVDERRQRCLVRRQRCRVRLLHGLAGVNHERAANVRAVLLVARAECDDDDAVVHFLFCAAGGHLEFILATGLKYRRVADVHVLRLQILHPQSRGVQNLILTLLRQHGVRHLRLLVHNALHLLHRPRHGLGGEVCRFFEKRQLGVVLDGHGVGQAWAHFHHGGGRVSGLERGGCVHGHGALPRLLGHHPHRQGPRGDHR
mmetsp:Transcript_22337/g.55142  ORF Transcript_22337/g.55142 Transcript_22337/m.55142 type:complete len:464 (-) Transcript_22337:548-1939(-)